VATRLRGIIALPLLLLPLPVLMTMYLGTLPPVEILFP